MIEEFQAKIEGRWNVLARNDRHIPSKRTQFASHVRPSAIQAKTTQRWPGTNNLKLKGNNVSGSGTWTPDTRIMIFRSAVPTISYSLDYVIISIA